MAKVANPGDMQTESSTTFAIDTPADISVAVDIPNNLTQALMGSEELDTLTFINFLRSREAEISSACGGIRVL